VAEETVLPTHRLEKRLWAGEEGQEKEQDALLVPQTKSAPSRVLSTAASQESHGRDIGTEKKTWEENR